MRFYWECVELMASNGGWQLRTNVLGMLHSAKMPMSTIDAILEDSGLFEVVDNRVVLMKEDVMNGIVDFDESLFVKCRETQPWTHECSRAPTGASTEAAVCSPARASTGASTRPSTEAAACSGPCIVEIDIDKEREREERRLRLSSLLNRECPHLQLMEEPLTLEEFDDLVMQFGRQAVQDVLLSMENETTLNKRSCFKTALSWLRARNNKQQQNYGNKR